MFGHIITIYIILSNPHTMIILGKMYLINAYFIHDISAVWMLYDSAQNKQTMGIYMLIMFYCTLTIIEYHVVYYLFVAVPWLWIVFN